MNESRLSWNIRVGDEQYTVRATDEESQEQFLERVNALKAVVFKETPKQASVTTRTTIEAHNAVNGGSDGETGTFEAGKLVKNLLDGKTYWKVAGLDGKFPRFPVSIWPEVIERDLCPMEKLTGDSYPLEGYTAVYEKNDKGNPKKVIALAKG